MTAGTAAGMAVAGAVVEHAPAKINLFLHVTGRRPDGYHLLDSLVVFAETGDRIAAIPADELSLAVSGRFASALAGEDPDRNLVLRAARALAGSPGRGRTVPGAALRLDKELPVASGIGGGSADAAATLRALCRLWGLGPDAATPLALGLGADVPVCLRPTPARMRGIGERLSAPPALPPFHLVLVNPGIAVSTPAVFAIRRESPFRAEAALPASWADAAAMAADLARLANDLEAPAIGLAPPIAAVLAAIRATPSCLLARMSGSGATCFGLYADRAAAAAASRMLGAQAATRGWWVGPVAA